ncbi:MAG: hypothetical protein AMJ90_08245 [candidate division Zixibacteria bacterium SM23_73_2]|nr:MAG: hypothetical protein AMJ90_08245 [candidate division Zixibacteria bacterium SM23_73_2]
MNENKLEFFLLTLFLVVTRFWDIMATYIITPDLEKETNPLVSILGQGWVTVIIFQIMMVSFIIILNHYSLFKIRNTYPQQKGYSYSEFVSYFYFGEKRNLMEMVFRFPKNKSTLVKALGYVLPRSLIVIGLFISLSSTLLIINSDYRKFYTLARPYYYIVLIAIVFLFFILFFKREYTKYQKVLTDK